MIAVADVKAMAKEFCRYTAVDQGIRDRWNPPIGAAHELGHLLISTSTSRATAWYGMGEPGAVADWDIPESSAINEIAASIIHVWIMIATDWNRGPRRINELRRSVGVRCPREDDVSEFWFDRANWRAARYLIAARDLTHRDVQTAPALRASITRVLETT